MRVVRPIFYYNGREWSGNIVYQRLCQGGGVSGDATNTKHIMPVHIIKNTADWSGTETTHPYSLLENTFNCERV